MSHQISVYGLATDWIRLLDADWLASNSLRVLAGYCRSPTNNMLSLDVPSALQSAYKLYLVPPQFADAIEWYPANGGGWLVGGKAGNAPGIQVSTSVVRGTHCSLGRVYVGSVLRDSFGFDPDQWNALLKSYRSLVRRVKRAAVDKHLGSWVLPDVHNAAKAGTVLK